MAVDAGRRPALPLAERSGRRSVNDGARPAASRLARQVSDDPQATYTVKAQDLLALLTLLAGKSAGDAEAHLARVRKVFPALIESRRVRGRKATGEAEVANAEA